MGAFSDSDSAAFGFDAATSLDLRFRKPLLIGAVAAAGSEMPELTFISGPLALIRRHLLE